MNLSKLCLIAACCAPVAFTAPALAAPVAISFTGSVSGMGLGSPLILDSFPVGTAVSFDAVFNENFSSGPPASGDLGPASGTLHMGALDFTITHADIFLMWDDLLLGYTYAIELTGTGPTTANGGTFRGISFGLGSALDVRYDPGVAMRYPGQFGLVGGFAELTGDTRVARVPLPGTGWLVLAALGALAPLQRRRAAAAAAQTSH